MTEATTNGGPDSATVMGYDRDAVERYFAWAEEERGRLERELDAAHQRIARARAALDSRRVLTVMVEDAIDEIAAKWRQADIVVGRISGTGGQIHQIHWHAGESVPRDFVTEGVGS